MEKKILHIADLHYRAKWLDEIHKCAMWVAEQTDEVDLIVLAGDLYDGPMPLDSEPVKRAIDFVKILANRAPVLAVRGTYTHDRGQMHILSKISSRFPILVESKPGVVILPRQPGVVSWHIGHLEIGDPIPDDVGFIIGCLPEPPRLLDQAHADGMVQAICAGFRATAAAARIPMVVAGHIGVTAAQMSNDSPLGQWVSRSSLEASNALVMLGHIHRPQMVGDSICYAGSTSVLNFGEDHPHGFYIHTVRENNWDSKYVETPHRRIVKIEVLENGNLQAEINLLADAIKDNPVLARVWPGKTTSGTDLRTMLETTIRGLGAYDFKIDIIREDEIHIRNEDVAKAKSLREKIRAMAPDTDLGVLGKADLLEQTPEDKLLEEARMV